MSNTKEPIWENPLHIALIGASSFGLPFYLLKQSKNTNKLMSIKEVKLYEKIYSREFKKWTFVNVTVSSVVTAGLVALTIFTGPSIGDGGGEIWFSPNGK